MPHIGKPLGRQFRMKFWSEHRKFEGKTLTNWAKPGTSSIKSTYSDLPVEAELFPEILGWPKRRPPASRTVVGVA